MFHIGGVVRNTKSDLLRLPGCGLNNYFKHILDKHILDDDNYFASLGEW